MQTFLQNKITVDVFEVNIICYYNNVNTSGCLISNKFISNVDGIIGVKKNWFMIAGVPKSVVSLVDF